MAIFHKQKQNDRRTYYIFGKKILSYRKCVKKGGGI